MTDDTKEPSKTDEPAPEETQTPDEVVAKDTPTDDVVSEATEADDEAMAEEVTPVVAKAPRAKAPNAHIRTEVKDAPGKYAVIETGGKQYRVNVGDRVTLEKLDAESGSDVTFDRVLLLGGDGSTRIGTPVVEGATVSATINDHGRGEKIVVFKFKAKKRYRRRTGHRQSLTYVTITGITG